MTKKLDTTGTAGDENQGYDKNVIDILVQRLKDDERKLEELTRALLEIKKIARSGLNCSDINRICDVLSGAEL